MLCTRNSEDKHCLVLLHIVLLSTLLVQVVLEVDGEKQLRDLAQKMETARVKHKLWVEQPENFATCIATAPYPKSAVAPLVSKLRLCRGA